MYTQQMTILSSKDISARPLPSVAMTVAKVLTGGTRTPTKGKQEKMGFELPGHCL
jgi:hypothetical protein